MEGSSSIPFPGAHYSFLMALYSLSRKRKRILLSSYSDDSYHLDLVVQLLDLLVYIFCHQSFQPAFQYHSDVYLPLRHLLQRPQEIWRLQESYGLIQRGYPWLRSFLSWGLPRSDLPDHWSPWLCLASLWGRCRWLHFIHQWGYQVLNATSPRYCRS